MPVKYPEGPPEYGESIGAPGIGEEIPPGMGMNVYAPVARSYLDFTTSIGKGSGVFFGLMFQLPKWGFDRWKVDEWIEISPVFQQYYQLTIAQKQQMESQIKQGLASVASAFSDFDLVAHDFRTYKTFLEYFTMIEKGKEMTKLGKKEEGQTLKNRGEQTLRAIFIDQVDVHTGEGIALKLIAPRWPTIIADFMKLDDKDLDAAKIAKKLGVSEAEGVVLKTKNVLYLSWVSDFTEVVKRRFTNLSQLYNARLNSITEYKKMVKPLLARYKMITEGLSREEDRKFLRRLSFWRPDAQAISTEFVRIWAWKPFGISDKYKSTRESFDKITAVEAGFTKDEVKWLKRPKEQGGMGEDWNGIVSGLPAEPSIDSIVRVIAERVEKEYKVKLTPKDLIDARQLLLNRFETSARGWSSYETWVWSPYYAFCDIPITRPVVRLPNGQEFENFFIDDLVVGVNTQNVIIGRCLELVAREKDMENYIKQMLGEMGVSGESLEEFSKIYEWKTEEEAKKEKEEEEEAKEKKQRLQKILTGKAGPFLAAHKTLSNVGLDVGFIRAVGPYEFAYRDIYTKMYIRDVASIYRGIIYYLKSNFGVPGIPSFI